LHRGRIMVAFGYHGEAFHGSQIQPNVSTVQGEIEYALRKITWWDDGCLEMSSRTDAGVNVRMNLACIDIPQKVYDNVPKSTIIRVLNNKLSSSMSVWDLRFVNSTVRSRGAISRTYLFRTEMSEEWPEIVDEDLFGDVCDLFVGNHNFTNFCRLEEDINPNRTIENCEPWYSEEGRLVGFSIKSEAFLWNQVRRIASALTGVVSGRINIDEVKSALNSPEISSDLGRNQSHGLILWKIEHKDSDGMGLDSIAETSSFTVQPQDKTRYKRWLSMAKLEMGLLLEREWLISLNSI